MTLYARTYTPGQRLNSAAEVMQALLDGHIIKYKDIGLPILLNANGEYQHLDGTAAYPSFHTGQWFIYTPPKRKVKSERWFAVVRMLDDRLDASWSGQFLSGADARAAHPNALTYVRAECEVEVD